MKETNFTFPNSVLLNENSDAVDYIVPNFEEPNIISIEQNAEEDENIDLLMNPHTGRPEMPTQEEYDEAIEEYREAFVEQNGREPVFEDLMQTVVQEIGVDNAIKSYKYISTAWINTAPESKKEEAKKQVEEFHEKYFGVRKAEQKVLGLGRREVSVVQGNGEGVSVVSSSKVEPIPQEEQEMRNKALEKETDTVGGFDPSLTEEDLEEGGKGTSSPSPFPGQGEVNGLPKSPFYKIYNGMKIATRIFKAAFNSIAYKEIFESDGSITFKSVERFPKLKTEGNPHLMDILDPDLLVPGVEVKITVAENPQDIPITIYEEQPLTGYIVARKMTFGEWQALDPENRKEGTIEYLETVPMTVTANIDGKEISFGNIIHTVNWWNRSKVAPSSDEYGIDQDRLIAENQDLTRAMRERVINGETSFVVDERIYSVTQKVEDKGDVDAEGIPAHMLRLSVNNPDATIAFLSPGDDVSDTDFVVNKGIKGREEYFEGEVVNKEAILNNLRKGDFHGFGKYFRMSRIGTTVKDGKVVPLYQAIEVVDNLDQKALSKAAKDFLMIDRAIKWHNGALEGEISAEQKKKFETIINSLKKLRLPLSMESQNGHRFTRFSQMYKEFYPIEISKGSKEYKLVKNFFRINTMEFYVLDSEGNVVNYKSPYGKKAEGYKAFLMDNSFDNNLEFKIINHKGEEKYIADVQPKISFKPAKQISNPVTTETKPSMEERQADSETSTDR